MALPPWCSPQRRCAVQCCDAAYVTTRWLSAEFINIALISIILNGIYFGAVVCTSANGVTCVAGFGKGPAVGVACAYFACIFFLVSILPG
jgi:hypothetical protein